MLVMCTVLALLTKMRTSHIMILTKLAWRSHMRMSHHQWWFIIVVLSGVPTVNPLCPRTFLLSPVLPTHPLVLKHSFSCGIKTFFLVVLKYFYCGIEKIQACGWFSNSYCPFQHSTFPTLICLQQSSLSRFKKDNFYIVDLHWLFESEHDLE